MIVLQSRAVPWPASANDGVFVIDTTLVALNARGHLEEPLRVSLIVSTGMVCGRSSVLQPGCILVTDSYPAVRTFRSVAGSRT